MPTPVGQIPKRHPITVQEYLLMGDTAVLPSDARVELIEGEIIDMPPIGPFHASKTKRLNRLFTAAIGERAIVSVQDPIRLGDLSVPQPDLALLRNRGDFYEQSHPGPDDVLLVVEVADTSLGHDRDRKFPLYARFGISEAWLIDIGGAHLDIYRNPDDGRYTTQFRVRELARIEIAALPGIRLDLRALF